MTRGGIIIPDIAKERLNQGFVKYKGPRVRDLKIGDYIIFSAWTGTLVHIEDEGKLILLPEKFATAVVEWKREGKEIPGVYFRDHYQASVNISALIEILEELLPGLEGAHLMDLSRKMHAKGVSTLAASPYFHATYEQVMNYIAQAFSEDQEWRNAIKVVDTHPMLTDLPEEKRLELVTEMADDDET